jgi:GxxExxY protein
MEACFEVYKDKGCGFLEAVYQECLAIEMSRVNIPFLEKPQLPLDAKGRVLNQTYEPEFICFDQISAEIKAAKELADAHRAQAINYLKATGMELALLVNLRYHLKIQYERFVNQKISRISRLS